MTDETTPGALHRYLEIERRLLAHRAQRWFAGLPQDEEAEDRFFDTLEAAGKSLTAEERVALRGLVIERALVRPSGPGMVDVASPRRTAQGPRRLTQVA